MPLRTFLSRLSASTSSFPHVAQALTRNFGERQAFLCRLDLQRIDLQSIAHAARVLHGFVLGQSCRDTASP